MSTGWSEQRKADAALRIHEWAPWKKSTGPKTPEGKAVVSQNGQKGGTRANYRKAMTCLSQITRDQIRLDLFMSIITWTKQRNDAGLDDSDEALEIAICNGALPPASAWKDSKGERSWP